MSISNTISIFNVAIAWVTIVVISLQLVGNIEKAINVLAAVPISETESPAADDALHQQEAEALLQSGWWTQDSLNTSTASTPCNLPGIACNHFGSITHISLLHNSQLVKKLDRFNFSSFQNLVSLDLAQAVVLGSIPPEIGTLSKLTHLDLSYNGLTGELPFSLGHLTQLMVLDISYNRINGSIPPQLGNLNNLVALNLSYNKLCGPIPFELGHLMTNLTHLYVSNNQIEGDQLLLNSLTGLTQLVELDAEPNRINGSIPIDIGNKLKNLVSLSLSYNNLNGPLPSTLGQLTKLTTLVLAGNQINGSIPPEIGNLRNLYRLDLSMNQLSGPLPSTILHHLTNLTGLSLRSNQISGSLPTAIGELSLLTSLQMDSNRISGSIPPERAFTF